MSQNEAESEFGKRTVSFNHIVRQECKYSCWLGKAGERGEKPDRTQEFVSIDVLDRARREIIENFSCLPKLQNVLLKWFGTTAKVEVERK